YSVKTSNCSELWSESSEAVTVTIHAPSSPVIFTNGDTYIRMNTKATSGWKTTKLLKERFIDIISRNAKTTTRLKSSTKMVALRSRIQRNSLLKNLFIAYFPIQLPDGFL